MPEQCCFVDLYRLAIASGTKLWNSYRGTLTLLQTLMSVFDEADDALRNHLVSITCTSTRDRLQLAQVPRLVDVKVQSLSQPPARELVLISSCIWCASPTKQFRPIIFTLSYAVTTRKSTATLHRLGANVSKNGRLAFKILQQIGPQRAAKSAVGEISKDARPVGYI
jgi:hypothetical protein